MTFATEFPDYPAADLPPIPAHWVDSSWRNEQCPHWAIGDSLLVFVDYPEAAEREFPESPRFTVHRLVNGMFPEGDSVVFSGDDWADVLAVVAWSENGSPMRGFAYDALRDHEGDLRLEAVNDSNFDPATEIQTPEGEALTARADAIDLMIFNHAKRKES